MSEVILKTSAAALWIQPNGPGTQLYFLGCHTVDDIVEPFGGVELVRKFKTDGSGWTTIGKKRTPPDAVTTTVSTVLQEQRDWIEKLRCSFNLYVLHRNCGDASVLTNYIRGQVLMNCMLTNRTYGQMVSREEDLESTVSIEISADSPLLDIDPLEVDRMTIASGALGALDIDANFDPRCYGPCGPDVDAGDVAVIAMEAGAGVTADIFRSVNEGVTWTAGAADPFAELGVLGHAMSIAQFYVGSTTRRILTAEIAVAGAQGHVAYSDNNGAAWTVVNIGGAAAGHGAHSGGALCVVSQALCLLASDLGYIYRSADGGATWTAVESGSIAVTDYQKVHMADEWYGLAVGDVDLIAKTSDGGLSWQAVAPPGAIGAILTCYAIDHLTWWIGYDTGALYVTRDGGTTWTLSTLWTGAGTGDIMDIQFVKDNPLIGYMAWNAAGPLGYLYRTINGGYTWDRLEYVTNVGLNAICAPRADLCYAVGHDVGGTAVVLKAHS